MAAFTEIDWRSFDVWAIMVGRGLASVEESRHGLCRHWLGRQGYTVVSLDCRPGLDWAIPELGRVLRWEEQFGYVLGPQSRNLDALRDGFEFDVPIQGGTVFEVLGAEEAWQEDERWFLGLCSIVQERSLWHLALGRRFFGLLVVPEGSRLVGKTIEEVKVPYPCSLPLVGLDGVA